MLDTVFPDFQDFLLSRRIVPEKQASYYAYWVSRFLAFTNGSEQDKRDLLIEQFLSGLKEDKRLSDWQIRQAEQALSLYYRSFLKEADARDSDTQVESWVEMLSKMREALRIKHYAYSTEGSYLEWVKRFYTYVTGVKSNGLNLNSLQSNDVRDFLSFLAIRQRVSSSTQNQAFNALLFFFRNVLKIELKELGGVVRARRGVKIPVVFTVDEVQRLFQHITGKPLLILQLLYGAGLRLMELARLRVQDIDFDSGLIFVRSSKGDKDRSTILPEYVKQPLRAHLKEVQLIHQKDLAMGYGVVYLPGGLERKYPNAPQEWGWQYVFPSANLSVDPRSGKIKRHHISEKSIQNAVKNAIKKSGIIKQASVHTLRHSFATHLLMNGVNIREIQELLGHKNVETTMIYTHVLRDMSNAPQSPLDRLYASV